MNVAGIAPALCSTQPTPLTWRWLVLVLLVGLLAGLIRYDTLGVGLLADDYIHAAMVQGSYPGHDQAPFDLYAFVPSDPELQQQHLRGGSAPWWAVVAGDPDAEAGSMRFAMLRPLSSVLLRVDHGVMPLGQGGAVRARHLHSLLWFVLTVVAAGLVFGRLFEFRFALVALLLFAIDVSWVVPIAWLANRCTLISAAWGLLAVWAHLGWRGPGSDHTPQPAARRWWIATEVAAMSASLAGGEYGLLALAYVLAWELLGARAPWTTRARALMPAGIPGLVYLAIHRALDYGVFGEGYTDLFAAPGAWIAEAGPRVLVMATSVVWATPVAPTELGGMAPTWITEALAGPPIQQLGVCALLLTGAGALVWTVRAALSSEERRHLAALALGAVLGLVPLTPAPPQARLLGLTQLGAAAVVAALIIGAARHLRRVPGGEPLGLLRRVIPLPFAVYLVLAHVQGDLRQGRTAVATLEAMETANTAAFALGDLPKLGPEAVRDRDIVVLNSLDLPLGLHGGYMLEAHGWPRPNSWRSLAIAPVALSVLRTDTNTLELSIPRGAWLETLFELNFRRPNQPLIRGDRRERGDLEITILDDRDGHPTRIRVRFPAPVDDPRYLWFVLTDAGLREWRPPAVGSYGIAPIPRRARAAPGSVVFPQPR